MANLNVENNVFELPIGISANGKIEKTLQTAGKFVDKDIHIEINTPDASLEVKENAIPVAVASIATNDYTTEVANDHAIVLQADATKAASIAGVKDAGFAADTDTITIPETVAEQATKTVYIKEGALGGEGSASIDTDLKTVSSGAFAIKASAAGTVSVTKAGWLDAGTKAETSGDETIYLKPVTLANTATAEVEYEEKTAPVLTEDGFLFINEGYIKDTKISLATLVPDDANITDENADLVYNTVKAYDVDGKLIVGTMGDAELSAITANDAAATIDTVAVAAEDGKFKVSGSKAIAGTASAAVATRGLATTDMTTSGAVSGTANVDAELDVIELSAEIADNAGTVKPVIKKAEATALSGDIATSAPAGLHYVAVSADAIEKVISVTPTVTSAGYGTAALNNAVPVDVTAGSAASDTFYIGINDGDVVSVATNGEDSEKTIVVTSSCEAIGGEVNIAGVLDVAPTSGKYIALKATSDAPEATVTGSVVTTVSEGYVTSAKTNTQNVVANFSTIAGSNAQYIAVYEGAYI